MGVAEAVVRARQDVQPTAGKGGVVARGPAMYLIPLGHGADDLKGMRFEAEAMCCSAPEHEGGWSVPDFTAWNQVGARFR
ncbi:hypothetical protein GCM10022270_18160 [Terriglobus aquaticus]